MPTPTPPGLRRWTSLFLRASEAVLVLDAASRILFVNRACEKLVGTSADQLVGQTCHPTPLDSGSIAHWFAVPPEVLAGNSAAARVLLTLADGLREWRRIEFLPFRHHTDQVLGIVAIVRKTDEASIVPDADSMSIRTRLMAARERLQSRFRLTSLIGSGPRHERLVEQMLIAAGVKSPVLILGEPGTGRRHAARTIHARSSHEPAQLVSIDPRVLPSEAIEHRLFGPNPAIPPRFADSESTTLLLQEVVSLSRDLQDKIAAALPDSPLRLVATSSIDPDSAFHDGRLRPDFYYAITAIVLRLPPLRDRLDELPLLAQHFVDETNARTGKYRIGLKRQTLETLAEYDWPGNLRELARVIESAHESSRSDAISVDDLPSAIRGNLAASYLPPPLPLSTLPLDEWLGRVEKRLIEQALERTRQNKSKAAELLGISRPRLHRRIKELGVLDLPEADRDA